MTWIVTASGKKFDFEYPFDGLDIWDIATALSRICRFGGHTKVFYPVSAHSIHVSLLVPKPVALFGLLHDAGEAYTGDIVRPLKMMLPQIKPIEARIDRAIYLRFAKRLPTEDEVREIKKADLIALATERQHLVHDQTGLPWFYDGTSIEPDVLFRERPCYPRDSYAPADHVLSFMDRFTQLGGVA